MPLEKNADMLIADHARKDVPPGSYSWKFIADSISKGMAQRQDKYAIGRPATEPRPAASGGLTKGTRAPFTQAEDAVLTKYILERMRLGESTSGNAIYMEWAQNFPRHPWQSWRERWVKILRNRPMDSLKQLATLAPDDAPAPQRTNRKPTEEQASPEPVQPQPKQTRSKTADNVQPVETDHPVQSPLSREMPVRPSPRRITRSSKEGSIRPNDPPEPTLSHQKTPPKPQARLKSPKQASKNEKSPETPRTRTRAKQPATESSRDSASPLISHDSFMEDPETMVERNEFYRDLNEWIKVANVEIEFAPRIAGRGIELFDLTQAVVGQTLDANDSNELDWEQIAISLGFSSPKLAIAQVELEKCYNEKLLGFIEAMKAYAAEQEEDENNSESDDDVFETAPATHRVIPSSSGQGSQQRKRASDSPEPRPPGQTSKRRRIETRDEIPATPDDAIRTGKRQGEADSPSRSRRSRHPEVINDSQEESSNQRDQHPRTPSPPRLRPKQSTLDLTPSQQLHYEDLRQHSGLADLDELEILSPTHYQTPGSEELGYEPTHPAPAAQKRRNLPSSFKKGIEKPSKPSQARRSSGHADVRQNQPERPKSTYSPKVKDNRDEIKKWVEHYQSLGYSHKIVVEGLERTTMTLGLASHVMQCLKDGQGVPSHYEGIWTDRDDKSLRLVDSVDPQHEPVTSEEQRQMRRAKKESDRIMKKHGVERMEDRRRFLAAQESMREGGNSEDRLRG